MAKSTWGGSDQELKRNGSGYYDPTAYKAMKNMENENMINTIMNPGEIWTVDNYRKVVVLAVHEKVCSILTLTDEYKNDNDIEVIAQGVCYTNPCMVSYKFIDNFESFIRTMKDDEFKDIQKCVQDALGLDVPAADDSETIRKLEEEADKMMQEINDLVDENERLRFKAPEPEHDSAEVIRLTTERDMYKAQSEMYFERLLER